MTKKFKFHGRKYCWKMTGWQAILLVAAEVAICVWAFAVLVYLGIMIDAIF